MAVKIKRKRPEAPVEEVIVDEADQLQAATEDTFDFLTENRNAILGGIGVLIALVIGGSLMNDSRSAAKSAEAREVLVALDALIAPTGEEAEIATTRERAAEAAAAAATAGAAVDGALATVAAGIEAPAALQSGDATRSAQAYTTFRTGNEGFADAQLAAFGQASALASSGDLEAALALLDGIGADEAFAFPAALHAARLVDTFGEPGDALTRYRAVVADHGEDATRANADHRAAQLEIRLGLEPVVVAEEGDEAGEGDDAAEADDTAGE